MACYNQCGESSESVSCRCRALYRRAQCMIEKANEILEEADNLIDKNAVRGIVYAIESIKKSYELDCRATKIREAVIDELEDSSCPISTAMETCSCLLDKASEEFEKEERQLARALEALECALNHICKSQEFREAGYEYEEKYRNCVIRNMRNY